MGRLAILFFVAYLVSMASALIDCLSVERPEEIRYLPRGVWVLIILVPFGAIAWFAAGRPEKPLRAAGPVAPPPVERGRSVAPDDDPEFLASLHKLNAADEELLRRWEEDLRRREDELRKHEPGDDPTEP